MEPGDDITALLRDRSDRGAAGDEALYRAIYDRLYALARSRLRGRAADRTLGATALVHEAWMRLVDRTGADWNDRNHFYAVAATAMRQIVIDQARRRASAKRGGDGVRVTLDDGRVADGAEAAVELLDLDRALDRLKTVDERLARVVEMRFFAGFSVEEIAGLLGTSARTIKRDWRKARALLHRELEGS